MAILAILILCFQFDDYNWDWSLQHISHHCLHNKLQVTRDKPCTVLHCIVLYCTVLYCR